jgi:hypothetical protein
VAGFQFREDAAQRLQGSAWEVFFEEIFDRDLN